MFRITITPEFKLNKTLNIYCLHGILTFRGKKPLQPLYPYLSDISNVYSVNYGPRAVLTSALLNRRTARQLARQLVPPYILIGHSNGCAIISRIVDLLSTEPEQSPAGLILIHPALNSAWRPPAETWGLVYWNPKDLPVRAAKCLEWWPLSKCHRWGGMGVTGIDNNNALNITGINTMMYSDTFIGHGVVQSNPEFWGPRLANHINGTFNFLRDTNG